MFFVARFSEVPTKIPFSSFEFQRKRLHSDTMVNHKDHKGIHIVVNLKLICLANYVRETKEKLFLLLEKMNGTEKEHGFLKLLKSFSTLGLVGRPVFNAIGGSITGTAILIRGRHKTGTFG